MTEIIISFAVLVAGWIFQVGFVYAQHKNQFRMIMENREMLQDVLNRTDKKIEKLPCQSGHPCIHAITCHTVTGGNNVKIC